MTLLLVLQGSHGSGSPSTTLSANGSGAVDLVFNGDGSAATSTLAGSGSSTAVEIFNGSGGPSTTLVGSGSGVATLIFNASGTPSTILAGSGSSTAVEVFNADGSAVNTTLVGFGVGTASNPNSAPIKRPKGRIRFVDQSSLEKEPRLVITKPEEETKQAEVYIPAVPDVPDVSIYTPDPFEISPKDWKKIVAKAPDVVQPVQRGRTRQQMEDEELLVMLMASAA